ncbi:MAG TPA: glycoside hydrolase family 3 C-terminal domain-containing protein [Acidobacteriaceae bacterium]|nr:glycoside hydrolase family 3 C-terminal domain-containing protein [Acidobacteriaceae bacterium]
MFHLPFRFTRSFSFVALLSVAVGVAAQNPSPDAAREQQIESMLHRLTLQQKLDLIGGVSTWYTHPEPSIGLGSIRLSDGPAGLRSGIPATAYPSPSALAASWDPALARRVGASLGHDACSRGVDVLLGPGVNLYRAPMAGRNFEYMGEDPWLASRMAVAYIEGVQSMGVSATVKHFALNNQEFNRHNASSDADERTMRELYLPAFEAAVKEAHVGAIMDSYNLVNGTHSTQNGWLNNTVAKQQWGFDGVIMSDWVSVYNGVAAANNGLDLEMPFSHFMSPQVLLPAIQRGQVSEAVIDDKVRRILRLILRFGMNSRPPDDSISLFSEDSDATARQEALESMVLLKNDSHLLPLDAGRICTLAVIGPNASPAVMGGGGSAIVDTYKSVSVLQGLSDFVHTLPANARCRPKVLYDSGWPDRYDVFHATHFADGLRQQVFASRDWSGTPQTSTRPDLNEDRIVTSRTGSLRWTGTFVAPRDGTYYVVVYDGRPADRHTVYVDGQRLPAPPVSPNELYYMRLPHALRAGQSVALRLDYLPNDNEVYPGFGVINDENVLSDRARRIANNADAVVISAGFDKTTEHEGMDRTFSLPGLQDTMIRNVAALNSRSVLVLNTGGAVDMEPWLDRIGALLLAWYPGQEGGSALADILFGLHSPEGKLPETFVRRWEDSPTFNSYYPQQGDPQAADARIRYTEGVFLGYRWFATPSENKNGVKPLFPFGFGLSYSTFELTGLRLNRSSATPGDAITASVTIRNTGKVEAADVVQLYVSEDHPTVPRPAIELKGFRKVRLAPGESRAVTIPLDMRSLAYWSGATHDWHVDTGSFRILAGDSSQHLPLHTDIDLR